MNDSLPSEISEEYLRFRWDREKIWALALEVKEAAIDSFLWHLEYPFWAASPPGRIFDLCPRTVLNEAERYPKHYRRILEADISYPIDTAWIKDRLVILDGIHRLAHLVLRDQETVRYRVVPTGLFDTSER